MRTLTKARDTYVAYAKLARLRGLMRLRKEKHCSKHRHLLLFANTFPPEFNSGVHRPLALVKYAANSGWKVTVVAGSPDGCAAAGATLAETIPDAVDILHWQNTLDYFWRLVPELDGGFGPCFAALELAVHHEPTTPYSIIMATGPSFSSFPAACAAGTQLRVPVVLDYRDEWSASPFEYVGKCATNAAWERRCLQAADAVLFTAGSQRDHAIATFPEAEARKCFVVPNGWEPEEHNCARSVQPRSETDRQFVLSYVGTLAEHTLHNAFLDDLASVMQNSEQVRETLRIRFIGKTSPMALDQLQQFKFQENLEHRGMVTKAEALQAMRESSCLLLMNDPRWHRYRQGKLFDYLATDIPILVYGHGGEMAELVTRLDAGVVVRTDRSASLEEAILSMLESRTDTSHSEDDGFREQWLTEHTRSQVTQKMLALFDQILVGKYVSS